MFKPKIAEQDGAIPSDDEPVEPPPGIKWLRSGLLTNRSADSPLYCASCFVMEGEIHRKGCKIYPTHHTGPTGPQPSPAEREG